MFLVWEADNREEEKWVGQERHTRRILTEYNTAPFAVTAPDSKSACLKVMRQTRRIGKYAVVDAEVFDFSAEMDDEETEVTPASLTVETTATATDS